MTSIRQHTELLLQLHSNIQSRKQHPYAGCSYRDQQDLLHMRSIIDDCYHSHPSDSLDISEIASVVQYISVAYNTMGRYAICAQYHTMLTNLYSQLHGSQYANSDLLKVFGQAYYYRNYYSLKKCKIWELTDQCTDIIAMVMPLFDQQQIDTEIDNAIAKRKTQLIADSVEGTAKYLSVIDRVEQEVEETCEVHIPQAKWSLKQKLLAQYGIEWMSPGVLNPRVMFD